MFKSDQIISKDNLLEWSEEAGIALKTKTVKPDDVFLHHRYKCYYYYFISRGFVRLYFLSIEGREITSWFASENMLITSPFSFYKDETNVMNFQALEETDLIMITREQIDLICDQNKEANKASRRLLAEFAMQFSQRIMSINTESAEYRYLKLLQDHPLIFQKAKLAYIASYLGITQQSLSRIRKNLVH